MKASSYSRTKTSSFGQCYQYEIKGSNFTFLRRLSLIRTSRDVSTLQYMTIIALSYCVCLFVCRVSFMHFVTFPEVY